MGLTIDRSGDLPRVWGRRFFAPGWRIGAVIGYFAVAAAIDLSTGQRYSSIWGSIAIVATVPTLIPRIRDTLIALGSYAAVWIVFNLGRAVADSARMDVAGPETIEWLESALFRGMSSSAHAQAQFQHGTRVGALAIVI